MDAGPVIRASAAVFVMLGANAFAQSSVALPQPVAVVKDADGKVVGQVVGFMTQPEDGKARPVVMLSIDGDPGLFVVTPYGLQHQGWPRVRFSEPGCVGSAYLSPQEAGPILGLEEMTGVRFDVLGPDPSSGTYRVFKSTTFPEPQPQWQAFASTQYPHQPCFDEGDVYFDWLSSIEEMIPSPLAEFHGPTAANPQRVWTIEGGDRLAR